MTIRLKNPITRKDRSMERFEIDAYVVKLSDETISIQAHAISSEGDSVQDFQVRFTLTQPHFDVVRASGFTLDSIESVLSDHAERGGVIGQRRPAPNREGRPLANRDELRANRRAEREANRRGRQDR